MAIGSSIALKEKIYELRPYKGVVDAPDAAVKKCPDCGGTGKVSGEDCPLCGGRRYVCAVCMGTGVYSGSECPFCYGEGVNPSATVDWERVDTDDPEDVREHADPAAAGVAASVPADGEEGLRRTVRLPLPVAGKALESNPEGVIGVKYDPETMEINRFGELSSKVVPTAVGQFGATGHVFRDGSTVLEFYPEGDHAGIYAHGDDYGDGIPPGDIVIPGNFRWAKLEATFEFAPGNPAGSIWEYDFAFTPAPGGTPVDFTLDTTARKTVVTCTAAVHNATGNPVTLHPVLRWTSAEDDIAGMTRSDDPVLSCDAVLTVTAI